VKVGRSLILVLCLDEVLVRLLVVVVEEPFFILYFELPLLRGHELLFIFGHER